MRYARDVDGSPVEITEPFIAQVEVAGELQGFLFTPEFVAGLTDEERAGFGARPITDADPAPAGQIIISTDLAYDGDLVIETATYGRTPVPQRVPALYCIRALKLAGLFAALVTLKGELPDDHGFHDYFERATHWERSNAELNTAAAGLGLTSEQVDDLFRSAEALRLADGAIS